MKPVGRVHDVPEPVAGIVLRPEYGVHVPGIAAHGAEPVDHVHAVHVEDAAAARRVRPPRVEEFVGPVVRVLRHRDRQRRAEQVVGRQLHHPRPRRPQPPLVPDHQLHVVATARRNHAPTLRHRARHRLLAEHVHAGLGGGNGNLRMHVVGGGHQHRVQALAPQQLAVIAVAGNLGAQRGGRCREVSGIGIAQRRQLGLLDGVTRQVLAEVSAPHQRKPRPAGSRIRCGGTHRSAHAGQILPRITGLIR